MRGNQEIVGSGIIISDDGYIITNLHIIDRKKEINVELEDGQIKTANVIGYDQRSDLAVIKISSQEPLIPIKLANSKSIYVGDEVFGLIKNKEMPKGDPITLAEVSAVLGVKKTSELIPLCHPLPIDHTATKIIMHVEEASLEVFCVVSAVAKTGVEMEAIMGVNTALITIYDLSKIVNPHLRIDNVKLLIKEGGKSGLWTNPDGLPDFLKGIF